MAVSDKTPFEYGVVISTNKYAGNFERNMCGYVTGRYGDCGVGEEMAEIYINEHTFVKNELFCDVVSMPDDHGCCRPTSIWDMNDRYKSLIIFFDCNPGEELIMYMKERAIKFGSTPNLYNPNGYADQTGIEILGITLIERTIKDKFTKY